jgi:CBS domain-containing protein
MAKAQRQQSEGTRALKHVREVLSPVGDTVHPDHELDEALDRLEGQEFGVLPVLDGDQIVGMLSRSGIWAGKEASSRTPRRVTVRHVMSTALAFCYLEDTADTARAMMDRHGVDHLLVVDESMYLVGLVHRSHLPSGSEAAAAALAHEPAVAEPRETATEGVSSTMQPGGLDVYADRPTIKIAR